ncbi:NAD(P)/FAD-dependent oxidoreductase [Ruegeria atlantica]|uniref:NAD(P)/FAD-dependent oxidoreductase n=1 Tax=Ruegeria atlantica TaxID=81569 RepID=UPI00147A8A48|nr:FAD-dependent oxidoreductase [Ruegeria atlantica]
MPNLVVIGGGVVGISCALALQAEGFLVTVIEPGPVGEGASWASCGCIAVGEIVPLSQPGMLLKVPGLLMHPKAPLTLRPSSALRLTPWFTRFVANARPSKMRAIAADLARLTFMATEDFKAQLADVGRPELLVERPVIKLFDGDDDRAGMAAAFDLARELGCSIEEVSGGEAHDIDPAIAPDFKFAALLRDWSFVTEPKRLVEALHETFLNRGGVVVSGSAAGFERDGRQVTAVKLQDGRSFVADEFVLAAGTRSRDLAAELGVPLKVEGVIGYSTALKNSGVDLSHTVFYAKGGFGITPYDGALAVAGTIEFAGANARPNWNRADILVEKARRVLPGLQTGKAERRFGRRPLTPDTRPIIGRSGRLANVSFATGHGQLGLTLGATTARLLADEIVGRPLQTDTQAFSPDRFSS